ncbi:C1 family peptidase [Spirosoma aerophilum]
MKHILFLTLFSLFSSVATAQKLHVIYIMEPDDVSMGLINLRNDTLITDMVHTIQRGLNFSMTITRLSPNSFTQKAVQETLSRLNTHPRDVIIVYYSGHGLPSGNAANQFANWQLNDGLKRGLPVDSVAAWVRAKSAHLGLILADYSPEAVKTYQAMALVGRTVDLSREVLRQLFVRTCGLVVFGSAASTKPSYMRIGPPESAGTGANLEEISSSAFAGSLSLALKDLCQMNPGELPTLSFKSWKSKTQMYVNRSINDPYEQIVVLDERLCPSSNSSTSRQPTRQPSSNSQFLNASLIQTTEAASAAARWQGLLDDEQAYGLLPQKVPVLNAKIIPVRKDLSAYAPPVISQGDKATCVAISIGYYMRSILEAHRRNLTNKAEILKLSYSPFYLYNQVKDYYDQNCTFGVDAGAVLDYLKNYGLPPFSDARFQDPNLCLKDRPNLQAAKSSARILDYVKLFRITEDEATKIRITKQALAENAPVVVGIQTTNSMQELAFRRTALKNLARGVQELISNDGSTRTASSWKPFDANSLSFGHAMCVVGYDDKILNGKGAFKIINSWGKLWGDNGYFWMSYQNFGQFAKYGYQAYLPPAGDYTTKSFDVDLAIFSGIDQQSRYPFRTEKLRNNYTNYTLARPMRTNEKFKFSIKTNRPTYLYLISASSTTDTVLQQMPSQGYKLLVPAKNQMVYPEKDFLRPEGPPGKEFLLFLFSSSEIPAQQLDDYRRWLQQTQKSPFSQRFADPSGTQYLGGPMASAVRTNFKLKKIGFLHPVNPKVIWSQNKLIVPVLVTIDHRP